MAGFVDFLRCIGRAALRNGGRAIASLVPFGEAAYEITRDACEDYRKNHTESDLRAQIARFASASRAEVHQASEVVASQEAAELPLDVRLELVSFLDQARAAVAQALTVAGPKRTYTLVRHLAAGDVADLHLASAGESSYLLKISRIPGGAALLDNERRKLAHLLTKAGDSTYRRYLPTLAESFPAKDRFDKRVNVFLHEPGFFTAEEVHDKHPALDGRHLAWIFKRLLTVLGFCQRQGVVHGAVLPPHVLLHAANHGVQLIGWGQSVELGEPINNISTHYRDWYPREVRKKQPACAATDLFLAAKCLVYLAGGDPATNRMPDSVPAPLSRFVATCLLPPAAMRPDDAWQVLDELDELLGRLYGAPKFVQLDMT
jgi:hypothetical protein